MKAPAQLWPTPQVHVDSGGGRRGNKQRCGAKPPTLRKEFSISRKQGRAARSRDVPGRHAGRRVTGGGSFDSLTRVAAREMCSQFEKRQKQFDPEDGNMMSVVNELEENGRSKVRGGTGVESMT
ncbi:unnamed protein product [Pleuronectes platessa]|uniref:Uncharacterized protein n=1 Tax=Pleuronectes platessa TaxID=8262 RepID=A0A9N7TYM5_PLEPL|nr:unnamed protein product [Pleuronectes platessa]